MKRIIAALISIIILAAISLPATAAEEYIDIATYEDLLKITDDPTATYRLVNDIDCANQPWTPIDFQGTFEGNGYAIMNLYVNDVGTSTRTTIDGNWKEYDTYFAGLFSTLENATVKNLTLLGVFVDVEKNDNTYIGAIAGYMADSTIENCSVEGQLWLTSDCKSFGVGGILGYGKGVINNCTADVTLVCIDTNKEWKDEQFMGGVYANGYPDVTNCTINIRGYDSDHGYVHDGGIGGMYILPHSEKYAGHIDNNKVTGFISFFEDNTNRRAYCVGDIGEIMNWTLTKDGNDITGFERRETMEYSKDLLPNDCENPEYDKQTVEPKEGEYGYTLNTCKSCDYSYKSNYTSLNVFNDEPAMGDEDPDVYTKDKENPRSHNSMPTIIKVIIGVIGALAVIVIVLNVYNRVIRKRHKKQRYEPRHRQH
ncbi:MAG: hypothetical protein IK036_01180 [Clostridia bacterium]|nr:hypothetical protein [Clostridia bacterium]